MGYKLTVNQPNLPKGGEVLIQGLGTFKNGETTEISDEQAEAYAVARGVLKEVLGPDKEPTGELRREPGPPLDKALEGVYGVTVEKVADKPQAQARKSDAKEGGEG